MIKAIIFDMDGVIIDSLEYHIKSWQKAFRKFNISPSYDELSLLEGMSFGETISLISKKYNLSLNLSKKKEIHFFKNSFFNKSFKLKIYEEILPYLNELKSKKIKLALVTGSNKIFVNKILTSNFNNIFDEVITGEDTLKGKPSTQPYLKAIEKLGINKKNIIVIENAPLGIESAKKAELKVYALETTLNKIHLSKADKIFKNHNKLISNIVL